MEHATLTGCGRGDKTSVSERSTTSPPRLDRREHLPPVAFSQYAAPPGLSSPQASAAWRLRRWLLKGCDRLFRPSCPPGTLLQRPLPATGPPLGTAGSTAASTAPASKANATAASKADAIAPRQQQRRAGPVRLGPAPTAHSTPTSCPNDAGSGRPSPGITCPLGARASAGHTGKNFAATALQPTRAAMNCSRSVPACP